MKEDERTEMLYAMEQLVDRAQLAERAGRNALAIECVMQARMIAERIEKLHELETGQGASAK